MVRYVPAPRARLGNPDAASTNADETRLLDAAVVQVLIQRAAISDSSCSGLAVIMGSFRSGSGGGLIAQPALQQ